MVCNELWVVHVKLLYCVTARSRQDFSRHDVHSRDVVLIELILGVHDSAKIIRSCALEDDDFSLA